MTPEQVQETYVFVDYEAQQCVTVHRYFIAPAWACPGEWWEGATSAFPPAVFIFDRKGHEAEYDFPCMIPVAWFHAEPMRYPDIRTELLRRDKDGGVLWDEFREGVTRGR